MREGLSFRGKGDTFGATGISSEEGKTDNKRLEIFLVRCTMSQEDHELVRFQQLLSIEVVASRLEQFQTKYKRQEFQEMDGCATFYEPHLSLTFG